MEQQLQPFSEVIVTQITECCSGLVTAGGGVVQPRTIHHQQRHHRVALTTQTPEKHKDMLF